MGTPFPLEEPFGEDVMRRVEEQVEEHAEEVQKERLAADDEGDPAAGDRPAEDVTFWQRLFRRR